MATNINGFHFQSHKIKSAGDKNIDNLKKIKKSKHEELDYENDKEKEKLAKGDIKPIQFTDNLVRKKF